jgi:hypothetical protein
MDRIIAMTNSNKAATDEGESIPQAGAIGVGLVRY